MYVMDTRPKVCVLNLVQSVSLIIFDTLINESWSIYPYLTYLNPSFKLTEANDTEESSLLKDTSLGDLFPRWWFLMSSDLYINLEKQIFILETLDSVEVLYYYEEILNSVCIVKN